MTPKPHTWHQLCNWHRLGVPPRFQGDAHRWRWYSPGCAACADKWQGRAVPAGTPTPAQLLAATKPPRIDWTKRHKLLAIARAARAGGVT